MLIATTAASASAMVRGSTTPTSQPGIARSSRPVRVASVVGGLVSSQGSVVKVDDMPSPGSSRSLTGIGIAVVAVLVARIC